MSVHVINNLGHQDVVGQLIEEKIWMKSLVHAFIPNKLHVILTHLTMNIAMNRIDI